MSHHIKWMLITADPDIARYAQDSGVHRIFIDMEVRGKAERQGHVNTHKAAHTLADLAAVREVLTSAELMVRLNPLHGGTPEEVGQAIGRGADRLMLPMFTTPEEVAGFRDLVPPTTPITFLAETPAALVRTAAWTDFLGPEDEVHFGLNDLSLAMGLDFLFEPLAGGLIDRAAATLRQAAIPFGIGGVARADGGELAARSVIGEHVRLGSTRAILSRAFHGSAANLAALRNEVDLSAELASLRAIEDEWATAGASALEYNIETLTTTAFELAAARRNCG